MKTKEQVIREAWDDLNINISFEICDKTGWYHGYFCNGITDIECEYGADIINLIDYDIDISGVGKFRPKSLQGIETNNGWLKIENELDLPILCINYHVFRNGILEEALYAGKNRWLANGRDYPITTEIAKITHYQRIVLPKKPKY